MPMFNLICRSCKTPSRVIRENFAAVNRVCSCGGRLRRNPNPPSTQVMETLDNGIMPQKVERLADAEELYRERSENDPRFTR